MSLHISPTATAHEKAERCKRFLSVLKDEASVDAPISIGTYLLGNAIRSVAYLETAPAALLQRIAASEEPKIVSSEKMQTRDFAVQAVPLSSYFTPEHLTSPLVADEQALLVLATYNLDEGFYFAFPDPNDQEPEGFLFAFARNRPEADLIEAKTAAILKRISTL
ncbi:MAG: hypothetical protein IT260_08595 [Saprospiraceae bacterium]|nr:hypothetical protein [Saprospiraceae bacterium]